MSNKVKRGSWTVKQAAALLGVSEKTIRRQIKAGVFRTQVEPGKHGSYHNIVEIPADMLPDSDDDTETDRETETEPANVLDVQSLLNKINETVSDKVNQYIGAQEEKINTLQTQVTNLQAQINSLREDNIKLLEAAKRPPWYKRLFRR